MDREVLDSYADVNVLCLLMRRPISSDLRIIENGHCMGHVRCHVLHEGQSLELFRE